MVADGQELFRAGLIALVGQAGGECPVIAEVSDWPSLIATIRARQALLVVASAVPRQNSESQLHQAFKARIVSVGFDQTADV
jgi:hypothetical protein